MQDTEMMNLWKLYDRKLEENLSLNRQNAADITRLKVQSFLSSMTPWKIFTVILGIIWVGFIDVLIIGLFSVASPFFLVSAAAIALLNKLAIGIYLYQLILIHQADVNEPILATQEKIARLKSSTLWVARLLFLQLPFWTTFYLTVATFKHGNIALLILQVLITLAFTFLAVWLFRNIRYANRDKKWFRLIFSGREWDPVLKSMDLLGQVQEYAR
ncbi:hypothetical protein HB364_32245 [Pseudoflavitalea sp. X16]|uniref:hypothetical protein n=1 Tax=Paraflavitalea devenefica TaxID=2716334 RepID=UPI00141F1EDE|nr:hypothetical protein [Paraflavitalea devenefica]NII29793.1 hypothetical protein [Paraflavitalea devenefica]